MSTQFAEVPSAAPAIIQRPADILALAQTFEITDQITFDAAGELRKICKDLRTQIVAANLEPKKTAKASHDAACKREKSELAPIDSADVMLKGKRESYLAAQEKLARDLQRQADAEARIAAEAERQTAADALAAQGASVAEVQSVATAPLRTAPVAVVTTITKTEGISGYYKYSATLIDAKAFVDAAIANPFLQSYLLPDEKSIAALAESQKEAFSMPGFELKKTYVEPVRS